jgi:asparagine synthase (glutamine-hydrolysing)
VRLGAPGGSADAGVLWRAGDLELRWSGAEPAPSRHAGERGAALFDGLLYEPQALRDLGPACAAARGPAELLLHAYLEIGEGLLERLRGVFALVLWDPAARRLLLVRDPLGIHPMYYAESGAALLVSAAVEPLVRQPEVSAEVNRAAVAEHLCHKWLRLDETYYRDVRRLPPGHALLHEHGRHRLFRYWNPVPPGRPVDWVRAEELDRFDRLFETSIRRCLTAGRPAIFLSGGLDSVSVAGLAFDLRRRDGDQPPLALSLVFTHPEANEEETQRSVARALGLDQVVMTIEEATRPQRLVEAAAEISATRPSPLLNLWCPAYHTLGLRGRELGCEAILTGNGGDEGLEATPLLAADFLWRLQLVNLYRLFTAMRQSYRFTAWENAYNAFWRYGGRPLLGELGGRLLDPIAPGLLRRRRQRRVERELPSWLAPDPILRREIRDRLAQNLRVRRDGFYLSEVRYALDSPVLALELEEFWESGRRMGLCMLHPFWDADLTDFLFRTPPELLYRGGKTKGLVRESLARRFPNLGFERHRKLGATSFYRSVLATEGASVWQRCGGPHALSELGIVDRRRTERHTQELLLRGEALEVYRIWYILSTESWLRGRQTSR